MVFGLAAAVCAPDNAFATVHVQNNIYINTMPTVKQGKPMYYVGPDRRGNMYDDLEDCGEDCQHMASKHVSRPYGELPMANPFFQPEKGKFGAVTEAGYARNSFNFVVPVIAPLPPAATGIWLDGESGKWNADQLFVKQDVSYGINDRVALLANVKYGSTKYEVNWDAPDLDADTESSAGIDQAGAGIVWRFYESADVIANIDVQYMWTKTNNALSLGAMVGHKVWDHSTVYGFGRAWGINWDDESYGVYVEDALAGYYIVFDRDISSIVLNLEAGLGVFTAFDDMWSAGAELVFGDYDWHSQAGLSLNLNYQPSKNFAVGIYGRMSVWDSADSNENIEMWWLDAGISQTPMFVGKTEVTKHADMMFGARLFLYF